METNDVAGPRSDLNTDPLVASGVPASSGDTCDIIVVGGGSAGCAMAARLAQSGLKVVLLEAGKAAQDVRMMVPALTIAVVHNPNFDWGFEAEPDPSIGGRVDKWPGGKRLGGGSAINGMIYIRGHKWDYDHWATLGATGWSSADMVPYFRRMETNSRGGDAFRGDKGPLSVSDNRVHYPIVDEFIEAATQYGIARNPDHNGANAGEGVDYSQASQRKGLRCSSYHAYLGSGDGPKPEIRAETLVQRIRIEGKRAVGVDYVQAGKRHVLTARLGVVVSAGTLNTPKLLMLSGIGPAADLSALNIEVQADLPGVGANLQEHVGTHVIARVNQPTVNSDARGLKAVKNGLDFLFRRRGAITSSMCHAQSFIRTSAKEPVPDVQISFTAFAFDVNKVGRGILHKEPAISLTIGVARPESRGRVTLRSADPLAPPRIEHQLLASQADVERLSHGISVARKILEQPAIKGSIVDEMRPGPSVTDADLNDYVRQAAIPLYHPVGTCRMGQDALSVVDPDLKVHGIDALWVADASIMPSLPIGNTNATAILIGDKGADHVLKGLRLNRQTDEIAQHLI